MSVLAQWPLAKESPNPLERSLFLPSNGRDASSSSHPLTASAETMCVLNTQTGPVHLTRQSIEDLQLGVGLGSLSSLCFFVLCLFLCLHLSSRLAAGVEGCGLGALLRDRVVAGEPADGGFIAGGGPLRQTPETQKRPAIHSVLVRHFLPSALRYFASRVDTERN